MNKSKPIIKPLLADSLVRFALLLHAGHGERYQ